MKIGEAGEAFFVFETEDDVPENLITSPILLPTRPETEASVQGPAAVVSEDDRVSRLNITPEAPELRREGARPRVTSEPEFLDLDAGPGIEETPKPSHDIPQYAHANPSTSDVSQDHRTPAMVEQDKRVDKMLENHSKVEVERSDVEYHEGSYMRNFFRQQLQLTNVLDVALDMKGYHASEQTPRSVFVFPSVAVPSTLSLLPL
jgi:phosphatidate phosphatase LPIN